jgi:outer membrane autotransporter protein
LSRISINIEFNDNFIKNWDGYNGNFSNIRNVVNLNSDLEHVISTLRDVRFHYNILINARSFVRISLDELQQKKEDCLIRNAAALGLSYTENPNSSSVPALGAVNALQPLSQLPGPLTILRTGPISVWVNGSWSRAKDNQTGADRSSDSWSFSSGINYQFLRQLSIGIIGNARGGDVESTALNASLDHSSYGVSVYATGQILPGIKATGTVSYENGDNDISVGTTTGSFDTNLFAVSGSLSGAMQRGALTISPQLVVSYQTVDRDAYIDSVGTAVSGSTLDFGSVSSGINFAYLFTLADTAALRAIKPFVGVQGSWEFTGEGNFATAGGVVIVDDNQSSANFSGGVTILLNDGANVTLQGSYFGAGADVHGYTFSGSGSLPLRMIRRFPNSDSTLSFGANAGLRNPIRGRLGLDVPFN